MFLYIILISAYFYKKALLSQGNCAVPQLSFSV